MRVEPFGICREACQVVFSRFAVDNSLAILLVGDETGEPMLRATVNLGDRPDAPPLPDDNHVWIKTWAENEGVDHALVKAGVIELRDVWVFVNDHGSAASMARLTPAAAAAADLALGRGESVSGQAAPQAAQDGRERDGGPTVGR